MAESGYDVENDGAVVRLLLPEGGEARVHRGELSPIRGWVSRRFDQREPAHTIVWSAELKATTLLRTEIVLPERA